MADQDEQERQLLKTYNDLATEYARMALQLESARVALSRAAYLTAYEAIVIARPRYQRA